MLFGAKSAYLRFKLIKKVKGGDILVYGELIKSF